MLGFVPHPNLQEYLVWRVQDNVLDWFELREGQYLPLTVATTEVIESRRFPGLGLNVKALLAGRMNDVLAKLQRGLTSVPHEAFVARMADSRTGR